MSTIYVYIIVYVALILIVIKLLTELHVLRLRKAGIYPEKGSESMRDVERLLKDDKRLLAIRCYRTFSKVTLGEAVRFVNQLNVR